MSSFSAKVVTAPGCSSQGVELELKPVKPLHCSKYAVSGLVSFSDFPPIYWSVRVLWSIRYLCSSTVAAHVIVSVRPVPVPPDVAAGLPGVEMYSPAEYTDTAEGTPPLCVSILTTVAVVNDPPTTVPLSLALYPVPAGLIAFAVASAAPQSL